MRRREDMLVAALVFLNMLSNTLLMPAVRPLFGAFYGGNEPAMHAFFSVNMLGAVIGAPLLTLWADRHGQRRALLVLLALVDAGLLASFTLGLPLGWLLPLRALQGAASVGALSLLMGYATGGRVSGVHGGSMGLRGTALVTAIALGAPIGTLLLHGHMVLVLAVAAGLGVVVAASALGLPEPAPKAVRRSGSVGWRALRLPALYIGVERFTVGCFVVTFSLYGHRILGLSDGRVGFLFSCFLVPFAALTWPMAGLAARLDRGVMLATGTLAYGACFLLLGSVTVATLPLVLALAGTASAAVYGPSLCLVASSAPPALRATAMGLANATGTLGMLAGTATAGIVSLVLGHQGWEPRAIYVAMFRIAGAAELMLVAVSLASLVRLSRGAAAEVAR